MDEVRVAVAGVGGCASALVHGCAAYRENPSLPGLITEAVGPYGPGSVRVVAAFDVDARKVGLDLHEVVEAPVASPGAIELSSLAGVEVTPGPLLDGIGDSMSEIVPRTVAGNREDVAEILARDEVDVLVNFLPVGSERATYAYAEAALRAGVSMVNGIPIPLAAAKDWRERFRADGLSLIGDDVKSQLGATYVHRALTSAYTDRGVQLDQTWQLNYGGNEDFRNMQDKERLAFKLASKNRSIQEVANGGKGVPDSYVGPAGYLPFLGDVKIADVRLEGRGFAGNPIRVEARFEGADSPNSAGVVYDAVRYAVMLDPQTDDDLWVSAFLMKAPPRGMTDAAACRGIPRYSREARRFAEAPAVGSL